MSELLDSVKEGLLREFNNIMRGRKSASFTDLAELAKAITIVEHEQESQKASAPAPTPFGDRPPPPPVPAPIPIRWVR